MSGDQAHGYQETGLVILQAVQAAQVTFEDYFMSDLNIAPLKIVGYEGVFGFIFMAAFMLPIVQRLPGNDGDGLHEDSFDTWHVRLAGHDLPTACHPGAFPALASKCVSSAACAVSASRWWICPAAAASEHLACKAFIYLAFQIPQVTLPLRHPVAPRPPGAGGRALPLVLLLSRQAVRGGPFQSPCRRCLMRRDVLLWPADDHALQDAPSGAPD